MLLVCWFLLYISIKLRKTKNFILIFIYVAKVYEKKENSVKVLLEKKFTENTINYTLMFLRFSLLQISL